MKNLKVSVVALFAFGFLSAGFVIGSRVATAPKEFTPRGFVIEKEVQVPLKPEAAFDAFTGDITPWWDHHFSAKPARLVIEPKPGGHFLEIFDDKGNGVVHATVTWSERGKKLVFRGALGQFNSLAGEMVHTFLFEPSDSGTKIKLSIHGLGEFQEQTEPIVSKVWDHFLVEQFKTYAEKLAGPKGN